MRLNRTIFVLAVFLLSALAPSSVNAQCNGQAPASTYCGNPTGVLALPAWKPFSTIAPCPTCATLGANTFTGTQTINPATGTINQGFAANQTFPSSGAFPGPILANVITVTNPGVISSTNGIDSFGQIQQQANGLRVNYLASGVGTNNFAIDGAVMVTAAADASGVVGGVSATTPIPGRNFWGQIGYVTLFPGATGIGGALAVEGEVGIATGASADYRAAVAANSQGPVQGSVLDAAFMASTHSNVFTGGGTTTPFQHLIALSKNIYGDQFPITATGDLIFSDASGTIANGINLPTVTVTANILSFPNLTIAGNGGAIFGASGSPSAGSLFVTAPSSGNVLVQGVTNSGNNGDGVTIKDVSTNNVAFFGVQEPSTTATRFGQVASNWGQLVVQGSTNAGIGIGTLTSVPLILGTNNIARMAISGAGALTITAASFTATGLIGLPNLATQAANTVVGNATSGAASPTALAMPSCSTAGSALTWTTNTGFNCNTAIAASTVTTNANLTGDVTSIGNATTLATVASAGTTGSSTAIPVITINAKGLTTSISTASVIAPAGTLTGATLAANVLASSLTSVGTLTGGATGAGFTVALGTSTVTGALPCANTPAYTGDVTKSAAGCVTVLATAQPAVHTWALAQTFTVAPVFTDASGSRTALGLGTMATQNASAVAITGGSINGTLGATTPATAAVTTLQASGKAGFGTETNPLAAVGISGNVTTGYSLFSGSLLSLLAADGNSSTMTIAAFGTGTNPSIIMLGGNGTAATATASQSGDFLAFYAGKGFASASQDSAAASGFFIAAGENHSAGANGTYLGWFNVANGGTTRTEKMRLAAGLSVGTTTDPGVGSLQLNAQIFMPNITTSSAAQTGTVCWTTGTGKFTVDTTVGCLTSIMGAKNITERLAPAKALDIVAHLDPFAFRYKPGYGDSGRYEQFGLGAEEVALADERLVGRDPEGTLSGVRYQEMTAVLAGAIQKLKADNDNFESRLLKMESRK